MWEEGKGGGIVRGVRCILPKRVRGQDFTVVKRRLGRHNVILPPRRRPIAGHIVRADTSFSCTGAVACSPRTIRVTGRLVTNNTSVIASAGVTLTNVGGGQLKRFKKAIRYFVTSRSITQRTGAQRIAHTAIDVRRTTGVSGPMVFTIKGTPATLVSLCRLVRGDS